MRFAICLLTILSYAAYVGACTTDIDLGGSGLVDGSAMDATQQCGDLVPPSSTADCAACNRDASDCQPNGCYGGYWCLLDASDCRPPPVTCP